MYNNELGVKGEQLALKHLKSLNYKIIARNVMFKVGEIDLVALDGEVVVFIEVKARENENFGKPFESVNFTKQKNLVACAKQFIHIHKMYDRQIRFDVVSILRGEIEHIKDAFWAN